MMRHLLFALLPLTTVPAQQVLDFERIEIDWPVASPPPGHSYAGVDRSLAIGAFVPFSTGATAVVARGGSLSMAFQPAHLDHLVGVPFTGTLTANEVVATLPAVVAGDRDRLAVVSTAGLRVQRFGATGFTDATAQTPLAAWANVTELRTGQYVVNGQKVDYAVGIWPGGVRVASIGSDDLILEHAVMHAPLAQQVLDATVADWVPGSLPELAVLMTDGLYVVDLWANGIATVPLSTAAGKLAKLRIGTTQCVTAIVESGTDWEMLTWPAGTTTPWSTGTFALPSAPTGLATVDVDGDAYPETVVSTTDSVRRLFLGTANGPQLAGRLDILDVRPVDLPANPVANPVPLVVADVDRDGNADFVVQSSATDRLIVLHQVRPQVQLLAYSNVDPGDVLPSLVLGDVGRDHTPADFTEATSTEEVLVFRLQLPALETDDGSLQFVAYPFIGTGYSPEAVLCVRQQLAAELGGEWFDIAVPVPSSAGGLQRFLFEITIVDAVGAPYGIEPLLVDSFAAHDEEYMLEGDVMQAIDDTWIDVRTIAGDEVDRTNFGFTLPGYSGTVVAVNGGSSQQWPGRYIGVMIPARASHLLPALPKLPQPRTVTNGTKVQ